MILRIFLYLVLSLSVTVGTVSTPPQSLADALVSLEQAFQAYEDNHYEETARLCETALPALRASTDEENLGECLSLLGAAYHRLGIFDLALQAMEECYKLDMASKDPGRISSSLNNLAGVYLAMGEYDMAERMITDAIEVEEGRDAPDALAIRYGMAADIYNKLGRYEEAIRFATDAYKLDKQAGRTEKMAVRLSQLAAIYLDSGQLAEAENCLSQAVPVFEATHNVHSLSVCRQQQGTLASKRGDSRSAILYLQQAAGLARETGNRMVERNIMKELADLQRETNPAAAFSSMERYIALNDSIANQETLQQLNEFRIRYELTEAEAALSAERLRLRNQKRMTLLFICLTAMLLAVCVGTFYMHRLRKRNERIQRKAVELQGRLVELGKAGDSMTQQERKDELADIARAMSDISPDVHLTPREVEVAKLCAEGLFSKEIGDRMGISQRTVETHKNNIFRKLGINTTIELVRLVDSRKDLFGSTLGDHSADRTHS